jgi:hypothetical protein
MIDSDLIVDLGDSSIREERPGESIAYGNFPGRGRIENPVLDSL